MWKLAERVAYVQIVFFLLALGLGWWWAGVMRKKERLRRKDGRTSAKKDDICLARSMQQPWQSPAVSVIMPVKGCRAHSASNWATHISMHYDGPLEFVFVGESEEDSAWPVLRALAAQQQEGLAEDGAAVRRPVRLHAAGLSYKCSQKIHNLASGAMSASPSARYLLFLDDDVECHPSTLQDLVSLLEQDPTLFMATGYPFDIPEAGARLQAYCILIFHLVLLIPFSAKQRATFVWGGCMLLRANSLRPHDRYGILKAWLDGGYSDDLILAAQCGAQGLPIATPSFAIFPQRLDKHVSWKQYWNYLRRQLFVLDTYANGHNRMVNYSMFFVSIYLSMALCIFLGSVSYRGLQLAYQVLWWRSHANSSSEASSGASIGPMESSDSALLLAACLLAAMLLAHSGLHYMTEQTLQLMAVLSPARPATTTKAFRLAYVWPALVIFCLLMPVCGMYTLLHPTVVWSGTRYHKANGKVVKVER